MFFSKHVAQRAEFVLAGEQTPKEHHSVYFKTHQSFALYWRLPRNGRNNVTSWLLGSALPPPGFPRAPSLRLSFGSDESTRA
jgi:hypothetical protein